MKHQLNNIREAAEQIRLSDTEKSAMRAHLLEMVRASLSAPQPAGAAPSPYFFFTFSFQRFAMPIAVLLIVAVGGTTTYAAQGSLPGGVLYPVKIYVNEPVQEALAVSDKAKVSFHTSVAQERLKEAEALAAEGKLDAQVSSEIEANFNDHVAKADTIATTLEESDPASGVDARITLDSSLAAHGSILAKIGDTSRDEQTKENSSSIASRIFARGHSDTEGAVVALKVAAVAPQAQTLMAISANNDASTSGSSTDAPRPMMAAKLATTGTVTTTASTTASPKKVAIQLQKKASVQLETAHATYRDDRSALSASTTARVTAQLATLDDQLDLGKEHIKHEEYDAARATFTDIIKQSVELNAFIEASKLYNRDFVRATNDNNEEDSDQNKKGDDDMQPKGGIHIDVHL